MQRHAPYLAAILAIFSTLMMSMGAELESNAVQQLIKRTYGGPEQLQSQQTELEIIRDRFGVFIICGGSFAGAAVYICLKVLYTKGALDKSQKTTMTAAFALSVLTSIFTSPAIVKYILKHNDPETCAFVSFMLSAGATWGWDILNILSQRWSSAAKTGGVTGLKTEVFGGQVQMPPAPVSPEGQGK